MNILSTISNEKEFQEHKEIGIEVLKQLGFNEDLYKHIVSISGNNGKIRTAEEKVDLLQNRYFIRYINNFIREWNGASTIKFGFKNLGNMRLPTIEYLAKGPSTTLKDYNSPAKEPAILASVEIPLNRIQTISEIPKGISKNAVASQIYHLINPDTAHFLDKTSNFMYSKHAKNNMLPHFISDVIRANARFDLTNKKPFDIYAASIGTGYLNEKF